MRTCHVCGRMYAGWRCPCRRRQHSHARKSTGGGGRKWRQARLMARVLGGYHADEEMGSAGEAAEMAGAGDPAGDVGPGDLPDEKIFPEGVKLK